MKPILILLLILPLSVFAQRKKDNKITVSISDTAGVFTRLTTYFYQNGYSIEHKDEKAGFIASTEKSFGMYSVKIRALIKDSTIEFTGVSAPNYTINIAGTTMERTFDPIFYGGMKGSQIRESWNEMDKIAKSFGTVVYSK